MQETKTSTRLLLVSAVVLIVILVTGPLGYRSGWVELMPSFGSVLVAVLGGLLVFVTAAVMAIMAARQALATDRNWLLVSMVIGLIPAGAMAPYLLAASVPAIHDISTDTVHPPQFSAVVSLRHDAPNSLEYSQTELAALVAAQKSAYPDVQPIDSDLAVAEALMRAEQVLREQGLEIVAANAGAGTVEATDTTFWFGFKDDIVVRVTARGNGSRLDLRSVSRVGQSDIGANAARIRRFRGAF